MGSVHSSPLSNAEDRRRAPATPPGMAPSDHPLRTPGNAGGGKISPSGSVQFYRTATHVAAAFVFDDRAVVTRATRDNDWHYEQGDTAEWFLRPPGRSYYWEFYVTPNGHKTAMHWERRPQAGVDPFIDPAGVRVAAGCIPGSSAGSASSGWWARIEVAVDLLESRGDRLEDGPWTTLAARYDYDRAPPAADPHEAKSAADTQAPALSSYPRLPRPDFHDLEHFAPLDWSAVTTARSSSGTA